jgi:hypothetical protein
MATDAPLMRLPEALEDQLVSLRSWSRSSGTYRYISLFDFVGLEATPDLFFGFTELMFPKLVDHKGGKFIQARFSESVYQLWEKKGHNLIEIQRVMNHVHISTLFQGQEVSDELAVAAAQTLAGIWALALRDDAVCTTALGAHFDDAAATLWATS